MKNRNKNNIMRKILKYGFIAVVSCFLFSCGESETLKETPMYLDELSNNINKGEFLCLVILGSFLGNCISKMFS
jgi:hypothetical protein